MPGSSIGEMFRVTTFGESHGPALGCVVDGCPPGLEISEADLQVDLDRRKPGTSRFATQRREDDQVRILSGTFEGVTTGTSIGLVIENTDQRSRDYSEIMDKFRPSHADITFYQKYGHRDYRGGGRASARETAMRVAAGAIAKKYLATRHGVSVRGFLAQMGDLTVSAFDWKEVDRIPFFCPDAERVPEMEALIDQLRREGKTGIPRTELLSYLRDAAEALDFMYEQHGLQHLDIKPANLLLQGSHAKVADFGMTKDIRSKDVSLVGGFGPTAILAGLFILTALASQVMPNPAVAVLLAPIAYNTANDMGISPYPLMMAVAVSASAAFLSPVGHSANILVMGPGGYRFSDYAKVGIPLTLLVLVIVLIAVPIFWPF